MKNILKIIHDNQKFLISSHVNPDPDAIGSELAMALFLAKMGKKVTILNQDPVPARLKFLSGLERIKSLENTKRVSYDVAIILDCGELQRIGKVQSVLQKDKPVVNIDHHITNDSFGCENWISTKSSSTCEMLFEFFEKSDVKINSEIAMYLYAGIMTDTGSFRYSCTTPKTLRVASKLRKYDFDPDVLYRELYESIPLKDIKAFSKVISQFDALCDGKLICMDLPKIMFQKFSENFDLKDTLFKFLRSIHGVEVFMLFSEVSKNETRVNFRSTGKVNVAKFASQFGGGGHHNASGCMFDLPLEKVRPKVVRAMKKELIS